MNREFFPAIKSRIYFENSGGTQPPQQVLDAFQNLINNYSQPGAYTDQSIKISNIVKESKSFIDLLINNREGKIILSSSATQIATNIANSIVFNKNDEIVLANFSHESAIGPFTRIEGIKYKFWNISNTLDIDYGELSSLINENTKLLVIPHVSNILGNVYDINTIIKLVKSININTKIYVDGVAYLAHRLIDVNILNVDYYVVSFYKFLGLRISMLYVKDSVLKEMKNLNHYFNTESVDKLEIGGIQYELCSSIIGIKQYICDYLKKNKLSRNDIEIFFEKISNHEKLLINYFNQNEYILDSINVKIFTNPHIDRVPIFSLYSDTLDIEILTLFLNQHGIECKSGNFYSKRLLESSNIPSILRISLAHYNSIKELEYLFKLLENYQPLSSDLIDFKVITIKLSDLVKDSFNRLVKDPYYKNERYKRYSLIDVFLFKSIGNAVFMQNNRYNSFLGNVARQYHNIEDSLLKDNSFRSLINNFINQIDKTGDNCKYLYVHQIRVVSDPEQNINPIPEGIHQDGYQYICICCVNQFYIHCPDNEIIDYNKSIIHKIKLKPNNAILLNDKKFFHNVTCIKSNSNKKGYRDIFVLTTIK